MCCKNVSSNSRHSSSASARVPSELCTLSSPNLTNSCSTICDFPWSLLKKNSIEHIQEKEPRCCNFLSRKYETRDNASFHNVRKLVKTTTDNSLASMIQNTLLLEKVYPPENPRQIYTAVVPCTFLKTQKPICSQLCSLKYLTHACILNM